MITKEQAHALVTAQIADSEGGVSDAEALVVLEGRTIERPWGWVFFYTSRKWHETGDFRYAIAGNAPYIVERQSGKILATGTALPAEHYIEAYERTGSPHG
ncbi:YrhB family protein [Xanthomonas cassavae CFBP 4642]|uniref:YrhB family protein n=1 Tax=Xanthomonas cassavae CFBP 4642 TaxID=1219375 RepID=A0ABS8HCN5_9XANT|nr:YrhB domain-containing protein [Xanthomonas cassavae]MCC4619131.1 YrhB family protein [Xanthomonas cassavae CFBP 4642]